MAEQSTRTKCHDCGREVTPEEEAAPRKPCPVCGSVRRSTESYFSDSVQPHDMVQWKTRRPGFAKPIEEGKYGDSRFEKTGDWNALLQVVDRLNGWYRKFVYNPITGKVYRDESKRLSSHRNRGSAKPKK